MRPRLSGILCSQLLSCQPAPLSTFAVALPPIAGPPQYALRGFGLSAYESLRQHNVKVCL